ncbi:PREDICTED: putative F-box protein At1g71320 [Camelina sativa]|uniref:F-box protein At1g71320 n=1 Tax=Camelina sativa TaxID=90675 RepID=A0ABM0WNR4_CAMSA|nr:PREDICTED: putative F-box protein At1g71320 [Camelina sativa]
MPLSVGFGKDIITKSYKVISMYSEKDHTREILCFNSRFNVKVISLDNGEQRDVGWYRLDDYNVCYEQTPVYANGSLFWFTLYCYTRSYKTLSEIPSHLIAIDLHTEQFRWVSLPKCYTRYSRGVQMWSLNERLCLSDVLNIQCSSGLDVWSLQESSTQNWEKLFSFNILDISRLDAKCWMLGLRAAYFRRIEKGQDQVSSDILRTAIWYSPTMISPSNILSLSGN